MKRVFNRLQVAPIIGERRVVGREQSGAGKSGQQTGGRQVGIRDVANKPELRRNARRTPSGEGSDKQSCGCRVTKKISVGNTSSSSHGRAG